MSALSKLEAEVAAIDRTTFGQQLFRAVRLAAGAAVGFVIVHLTSVTGVNSIAPIVGGATLAAEVAFRSVFTVTATSGAPDQPVSGPYVSKTVTTTVKAAVAGGTPIEPVTTVTEEHTSGS